MTKTEFIAYVAKIAVKDWNKRHIMLPSVVIAQACKESSFGTSELATNANALFGIKLNGWNGDSYKKKADEQNADGTFRTDEECLWRKYKDWEESIIDHTTYVSERKVGGQTSPNYKSIIGETNVKKVIAGLVGNANRQATATRCTDTELKKYVLEGTTTYGYHTGLNYSQSLLDDYIIKYNLTQYDPSPSDNTSKNEGGNNEVSNNSSYTLKTNLADKSNYGSSRSTSSIKYIVWHYTANDGDTDEANGKYFNSPNRNASAHYFVDDDSITQSVPDNYVAWSVGGNRYSNYKTTGGAKLYGVAKNANTLNIELCDTQKNGKYNVSDKTLSNAIALTKDLMKKYNIPIENVIRHFDVTGKSCPAYYVDEVLWNEVKNKIQKTLSSTPISQNLYRVRKSWTDNSSQTGAYSSLENAKKNCKVGYSVFDSNGNVVYSNNPTPTTKKYHRVQIGAYKNKSGAIALQNKLKASGFDAIVKEVGGLYKVQIGAYSDVKNAEAMLKKVKAKGYSAFISYS